MSEQSQGPGWWQASDDKWYPPETHPDYRPPPPPATEPGPRRDLTYWLWRLVPVVAVVGLIVIGLLLSGDDDNAGSNDPGSNAVQSTATSRERSTTDPPRRDPLPTDFTIDVVVTDKQCFGSAGCNLEYEVDLNYVSSQPLDEDGSWTLIYEVTGDESGVQIKSLELRGDGQFTTRRETMSTTSSDVTPTAKVTRIR